MAKQKCPRCGAKPKKIKGSSILVCSRCGYRWAIWAYSFYWRDTKHQLEEPVTMATRLANRLLYIENLIDKCNYLAWWMAEDDGEHGVAVAPIFSSPTWVYPLSKVVKALNAKVPFMAIYRYPRYKVAFERARAKLLAWCHNRVDLNPTILQKVKDYKVLSSNDLWPVIKPLDEYRNNPFGPSLGPRVGEYVRQRVSASIDACFAARKVYSQHPESFTGRPQFPGLYYDGDQVTIEVDKRVVDIRPFLRGGAKSLDGLRRVLAIVDARKKPPAPPKCFPTIPIPIWNDQFLDGHFKTIKIKPIKVRRDEITEQGWRVNRTDLYKISICYEKRVERDLIGGDKWLGINLGGKILAACTRNDVWDPFLISAIPCQNANEYATLRVGEMQRRMMQKCKTCPEFASGKWTRACKTCDTNRWTRAMYGARERRANFIETYLHQASNYIISYCVEQRIGSIAVGHSPGTKQKAKEKNKDRPLRNGHVNGMYFRRVRRMFQRVPIYGKFLHMLQYKAEASGIQVLDPIEMDASLTSALDLEIIGPGVRPSAHAREDVHNRLFHRPNGRVIHKDINAALNILRIALGSDDFIRGLPSRMPNPKKIPL